MILVDSCGWLEYFTDGPLADHYFVYLRKTEELIVPTVVLYEVYKKVKRETSEEQAILAVAQMKAARIIPLRESVALLAGDLSLQHNLPMADAFVLATARSENSLLVTSDQHFKNLEHVKIIEEAK